MMRSSFSEREGSYRDKPGSSVFFFFPSAWGPFHKEQLLDHHRTVGGQSYCLIPVLRGIDDDEKQPEAERRNAS